MKRPQAPKQPRRWMSRSDAARYFGCDPKTLDRLAAEGLVTRGKLGKGVRFDAAEIEAHMLRGVA